MRVISRKRLREFWSSRKDKQDSLIAERELRIWHKSIRLPALRSFAELKQVFPSADQVGHCTVFDIANNRYRLIGRVNFRIQRVYVLAILAHADYEKKPWAEDCGCYRPPPKPPTPPKPKGKAR